MISSNKYESVLLSFIPIIVIINNSSDPPTHFFKGEELNFDYIPQMGEGRAQKLKKGVGIWCRCRSPFSYLTFSRVLFLHLEITICKIKEKLFLSATIILEKNIIFSYEK